MSYFLIATIGLPSIAALVCAIVFIATRKTVYLNYTMALAFLSAAATTIAVILLEDFYTTFRAMDWREVAALLAIVAACGLLLLVKLKWELSHDKARRDRGRSS